MQVGRLPTLRWVYHQFLIVVSSFEGQFQTLSKKCFLPKSLWDFEGKGKTAHLLLTQQAWAGTILENSLEGSAHSFRGCTGASFTGPQSWPASPSVFLMQQQLRWECWEGPPQDVLSRHCLLLAALMDSVISRRALSADRQSGRRWQVKNSLLAKRLRCGPCYGNCSDERPLGQEVRSGTQGAGPLVGLTPFASSLNLPQC